MITEAGQLRLRRTKEKHAEGLFLWELQNSLDLSPRESEMGLDSAGKVKTHHWRSKTPLGVFLSS